MTHITKGCIGRWTDPDLANLLLKLLAKWRIIIDEVHNEHNPNSGTIIRLREINNTMPNNTPRKILISGTSFETTPAHMAGWIEVMQDKSWRKHPSALDYPRMNAHQRDLVHCTKEALEKLGKEYDKLTKALVRRY